MRILSVTLAILAMLFIVVDHAFGQVSNSGRSSGSSFGGGSSPFGSGASGFGSQINAGFGNTGGGLGGGLGGGAGGQLGGFGGSNALTLNQQTGQLGGQIGRTSEGTGAMFEALNQSGNQFLNRLERSMNSANRGRGRNQDNDAAPPIRVKLKLGFRPPPTPASNLAAPTAERLNEMLATNGFAAQATLTGGVAVLTGEVASEGDRQMLQELAGLEPGVARVDNQLTVVVEEDLMEPELLAPPN